ncbi:MAG TPA: ImmA/IrrE family metallo-endopeptidase [Gammaproteobacteria bacterium]
MRPINAINAKVRQLLDGHSVNSAPVDVYRIIKDEGINLSLEEMEDDHSGVLLVENGIAAIAVNSTHHPHRQRFSAAHELGHFILHSRGRDRLFVDKAYRRSQVSSSGTDKDEIEANRFAAALLMPEDLIRGYIGNEPITDMDIAKLALKFQVSEQAMTLRLVNLGLIES